MADAPAAAAAAKAPLVTCQGLLDALPAGAWDGATTSSPFIEACAGGSVAPEQFNRWLTQDYLYVRAFVGFIGATLAAAPDGHLEVVLRGAAALVDELSWFRAKAAARGLPLETTEPQPACAAYRALLRELRSSSSYALQAVALWAIELCYHQAWGSVLRGGGLKAPEGAWLGEFAERWGSAAFGAYVEDLRRQADEALAAAPPEDAAAARALVARIAGLEVGFWSMAFYDGGDGGRD